MRFLSALAVLLFGFSATAETIESVEYKYYEISPRTPYEIKPELIQRSPIRAGNGSYNGHTDWYIDWKYQTAPGPYGCQLASVQTRVHVLHILPALNENVSDMETIEVFNKFNTALNQHEKNHGDHGLSAAREMDKIFGEVQPQRNCRELARMLDGIGQSIVQKYTQLDREYDRTTNNGETEGAVIY